jgi:glutamate dehydrogenase
MMLRFFQRTSSTQALFRPLPFLIRNFSSPSPPQDQLVNNLIEAQSQTAKRLVPWFVNNMPAAYFRSVPEASRIHHLMTLSSLWDSGLAVSFTSQNKLEDGKKEVTVIQPGTQRSLVQVLKTLKDQNIHRMFEFTSQDNKLKLNIFQYDDNVSQMNPSAPEAKKMFDYAEQLMSGAFANDPRHASKSDIFSPETLTKYIEMCPTAYVVNSTPRRFFKHIELFSKVDGTESCAVSFERFISDESPNPHAERRFWVDQAISNSLPKASLYYTALLLEQYGFEIERTHLDVVKVSSRILCHQKKINTHMQTYIHLVQR